MLVLPVPVCLAADISSLDGFRALAAQALKEFEVSLQAARNRYRGFYGAAKAAERSGDRQKARAFYEKLVALCSHADTERPELTEAKAFLAKK